MGPPSDSPASLSPSRRSAPAAPPWPAPTRPPHPHQVAERPEVRPEVVEYRLHRLVYPRCRKATRAALPPGVPAGALGPRLLATVALLTGLEASALADLLGLQISTGMVSKAERRAAKMTAEPVTEVARAVAGAAALNVEETGWRQARKRAGFWTAVGAGMTLFRNDRSRGADALRWLIGAAIAPVITSDRFPTSRRAPVR